LTGRPFSFFPPLLNIEHNEWLLRKTTWSEILVANAKTGMELWVPRRFLGDVSSVDEPVMIVGLNKELEYKAGAVWPHERRVIEMPRAGASSPPPAFQTPDEPAPGAGIGFDRGTELRISRLIGAVLLAGVLASVLLVLLQRRPVVYHAIEQSQLGLTAEDDYHAVVRKLGPPVGDRWRDDSGELQYRMLKFRNRSFTVVLMGTDRDNARYIGALGKDWKPVHFVELPGGGNTLAMLRGLKRF